MLVENYFHGCYCDSMLVLFFFFAEFLLASHEIFRHFEWRVIL